MNKALTVAISEFTTLTRSRAFLIGISLMPILMAVSVGAQRFAKDAGVNVDHRFVVVDRTGVVYDTIQAVATQWNQRANNNAAVAAAGRYLPEAATFPEDDRTARQRLSDRVRHGEIYAFVEIPAGVLAPSNRAAIRYYSSHAADRTLPSWIETTVNAAVVAHRFKDAHVDPLVVTQLMHHVGLEQLGLVSVDAHGAVKDAAPIDPIRTQVVPLAMMFILVFSVMATAPQLLNSVIEEKMSRISEVLIGSVTPFELMAGKLLGTSAVSILLAAVYVVGGIWAARHYGYGDAVVPAYIAWLFAFIALAILMYGSVFVAIGASCSDLKDTQAMMPPAMLLIMLPFMVFAPVMRAPESSFALGLSLWPTASPFLMMLRIAIPPGPPMWQVLLAFVLTAATATGAVYAAGKIFRTGLLMQGKAASFGEMIRWVRA